MSSAMDNGCVEFDVEVYCNEKGKRPFADWLRSLKDGPGKRLILLRIQRLRSGNLGDSKVIASGLGLRELRIQYGPGYRIYLAKVGELLVMLFGGGTKRSQERDIERAKKCLLEYKRAKR